MSLDLSAGRLPTPLVVASSPSSGRVSTAYHLRRQNYRTPTNCTTASPLGTGKFTTSPSTHCELPAIVAGVSIDIKDLCSWLEVLSLVPPPVGLVGVINSHVFDGRTIRSRCSFWCGQTIRSRCSFWWGGRTIRSRCSFWCGSRAIRSRSLLVGAIRSRCSFWCESCHHQEPLFLPGKSCHQEPLFLPGGHQSRCSFWWVVPSGSRCSFWCGRAIRDRASSGCLLRLRLKHSFFSFRLSR